MDFFSAVDDFSWLAQPESSKPSVNGSSMLEPRSDSRIVTAQALAIIAFDNVQISNAWVDQHGGLAHCPPALAEKAEAALIEMLTRVEELIQIYGWAQTLNFNQWFPHRSPAEYLLMADYVTTIVNDYGTTRETYYLPVGDTRAPSLMNNDILQKQTSPDEAVRRASAALLMYLDHEYNQWWEERAAAETELMTALDLLGRVVGWDVLLSQHWFVPRNAEQAQALREALAKLLCLRTGRYFCGMEPIEAATLFPWELANLEGLLAKLDVAAARDLQDSTRTENDGSAWGVGERLHPPLGKPLSGACRRSPTPQAQGAIST